MRSRTGMSSISALRPDRPAAAETWSRPETDGPIPGSAGIQQAYWRLMLLGKKGGHDASSVGKGHHQLGIIFLRPASQLL